MGEQALRLLIGGTVVSLFGVLGENVAPKELCGPVRFGIIAIDPRNIVTGAPLHPISGRTLVIPDIHLDTGNRFP